MEELLRIFDLKDLEIRIYLELFNGRDRTAKDLTQICGVSPATIYPILSKLVERGLITSHSQDSKKHYYNAANPHELMAIRDKIVSDLTTKSEALFDLLSEKYRQLHSKAVCTAKPTHILITETELSFLKLREYLLKAKNEVIFIGIPLDIIDKIGDAIEILDEKNIRIEIFIPNFDFVSKYYKKIDKYKPKFMTIPHHQIKGVNDEIFFTGNILIDRIYLMELSYNDQNAVILTAFSGPNCIRNCILPSILPLVQESGRKPKPLPKEEFLLNLLKKNGALSKKELSKHAGLSGKSLNEVLEKLRNQNKIQINLIKSGKGRPREEIMVIP